METPDFVKAFIDRESWTFAKTYADRAPHEYVVRGKQKSTDDEYMAVVNYIAEKGITMHFWNHPNRYIFVDGYQYWVMKDSDDDPSMVLNRCDLSQYKLSIEWIGNRKAKESTIDTTFDFTTDTPNYWEGFWDNYDLGYGKHDPDSESKTLRHYHKLLWSNTLPNGQYMDLEEKPSPYYLSWNGFELSSDSIIIAFRNGRNRKLMEQLKESVSDFRAFAEDLIHRSYTIGGMMVFPCHKNSMNQCRGMRTTISDRWDLTLECIRRHYAGEDSPLRDVIEADKAFYDLFVDFKGYVDFFYLNDCVDEKYEKVDLWCGEDFFAEKNARPKTLDEFFKFIDNEFSFLEKRNERIRKAAIERSL